jgi:hypothetical protein
MLESLLRGGKVAEKAYYKKFAPEIDWEWVLVAGVIVEAFLSATLSGGFHWEWVPSKWAASFEDSSFNAGHSCIRCFVIWRVLAWKLDMRG